MTDNITLPRAVVEQVREALEAMQSYAAAERKGLRICDESIIALDAALAEPEQKPEPVHPGYVIGSHWLETAYSRIAAGEAEADVLAEALGARGWVKPEPATDEQVTEAYIAPEVDALWRDFAVGFRAAERFHGIGGSKT